MNQVLLTTVELNILDFGDNVRQSNENWHDNEFNESILATGNLGSLSIAEHGDLKTLCLLTITLLEKLFEKKVSPDCTEVEFP